MTRIACWITLAVLTLAIPTASLAQNGIPRIGLLRSSQPPDPFTQAFINEMQALGYVEGRTVVYEMRWAEGNPDRLPALARDLAERKVDVILTGGDNAVKAAKEAAPTIPIVMGASNDPVGIGVAESLAHPRGTVTGLTIFSQELSQKRLELFREAMPKLERVAVLYNPAFPSARADLDATETAARSLGMTLRVVSVAHPSQFEPVFAELSPHNVDGLITLADPFFTAHRSKLAQLARTKGLPTMFHWREFVQAGGLMSYGPDNVASYRRAAHFVARILKGAQPGTLPIEQPASFVLGVNLQTARTLGLTIPTNVLARADEVIE
jgi:putative tryptophan/tyrosine transport system substrate-binding protein